MPPQGFQSVPNGPQGDPDSNSNLLPLESHLPMFYQALQQKGQVSMDGVYAILRDLANRMQAVESSEQNNGPQPDDTNGEQPEPEAAPSSAEKPNKGE